jgi:hypothetical protein
MFRAASAVLLCFFYIKCCRKTVTLSAGLRLANSDLTSEWHFAFPAGVFTVLLHITKLKAILYPYSLKIVVEVHVGKNGDDVGILEVHVGKIKGHVGNN